MYIIISQKNGKVCMTVTEPCKKALSNRLIIIELISHGCSFPGPFKSKLFNYEMLTWFPLLLSETQSTLVL